MKYITLIGDSIFDNKSYVGKKELDTVGRLREQLQDGEKAKLVAVDGNVTDDVHKQIARIPTETTHLILSVGGNDALAEIDILDMNVSSSGEVLDELYAAGNEFALRYERLVGVLHTLRPLALCTIYYPCFPDATRQKRAVAALSTFNDAIIYIAGVYGLPVIDLRAVCNEVTDYANPIEPSSAGSEKIAKVIRTVVDEHDFTKGRTTIYS